MEYVADTVMAQWHFSKHNGFDDINASTSADSFIDRTIKDLATALVREGVQNAIDARRDDLPDDQPARIRITLNRAGQNGDLAYSNRWFDDLFPHLGLRDVGAPEAPGRDDPCDLLIFEDFGTTGLTGDFTQPYTPGEKNNFVNFLYHEGVTDKGDKQRGSRGVGKIVFTMASRARTFFAYTIRAGQPTAPLLIGKNILKYHQIEDDRYRGQAYFVQAWPHNGPREPVDDEDILSTFLRDFPLFRETEPGLSVVIPFLDESVKPENIRDAVVTEFHYAILAGKLEVTIDVRGEYETFDSSHLPSIGDDSVDGDVALARWALAESDHLTTKPPTGGEVQRLDTQHVHQPVREQIADALDQRRRIAIRMPVHVHPKNGSPLLAHFDVFLEHSETYGRKPTFIRELLPVTGVRNAKSAPHVRALVVIDSGPLANLLRAAEGANHTDWSPRTDRYKENYLGRRGEIVFVAQSVSNLMAIVRGNNDEPVGGIATHFFSARFDDEPRRFGRRLTRKGHEPDEPPPEFPSSRPRRYDVQKVSDGFIVRGGDPGTTPPARLTVRVAYDVARGSAWSQWDPADFDFSDGESPIRIEKHYAEIDTDGGKGNSFVIVPAQDKFNVIVRGFDPHRDLIIDPKPEEEAANAGTAELHESQQAVV